MPEAGWVGNWKVKEHLVIGMECTRSHCALHIANGQEDFSLSSFGLSIAHKFLRLRDRFVFCNPLRLS